MSMPLDDRALHDLWEALLDDDPGLARRLQGGPQRPLYRARRLALLGSVLALVLLVATATAGAPAVAVLSAAAVTVLALFAASVSVLLYVSRLDAAARLAP
jgi:type VI protein secretion system component VasK